MHPPPTHGDELVAFKADDISHNHLAPTQILQPSSPQRLRHAVIHLFIAHVALLEGGLMERGCESVGCELGVGGCELGVAVGGC